MENTKQIAAPGIGTVAFPADMQDDEITSALVKHAASDAPAAELPDSPEPTAKPGETAPGTTTKPAGKQSFVARAADAAIAPYKDHSVRDRAIAQAAAEALDIYTTRQAINAGRFEEDPIITHLVGVRPGTGAMVAGGVLENVGAAMLSERMKHSDHPAIRKLAWLPQLVLTGAHAEGGIHNLKTK